MARFAEATAELPYTTLDVFTTTPFQGNPLAVVRLGSRAELSQEQKQAVAKEFNYSETVFLHAAGGDESDNTWPIDIFTTEAELPFAGHPVVGTACSIFADIPAAGRATLSGAFLTKAGRIELEYDVQKRVASARIPHNTHLHSGPYSREMLSAVQPSLSKATVVSRVFSIVKGMTFVLVELSSLDELEATSTFTKPIGVRLDDGWNEGFIGMYVYTRVPSTKGADGSAVRLRTRMFESTVGEDSATGSAACALACCLALHERPAGSTTTFEITQGVEMGRRSDIGVEVVLGHGAGGLKEVSELRLMGQAVVMMRGAMAGQVL